MCLAPCFKGCSDERYAEETAAVREYLATRGASLLKELEANRNRASEALEFEAAAQIHARMQKVAAAAGLAAEIVRPLAELNGVVLQPSAEDQQVAVFLVAKGRLAGPAQYSTVGMRHPNEQSGSSSLFAHPTAIEPVLLEGTWPAKRRRGQWQQPLGMCWSRGWRRLWTGFGQSWRAGADQCGGAGSGALPAGAVVLSADGAAGGGDLFRGRGGGIAPESDSEGYFAGLPGGSGFGWAGGKRCCGGGWKHPNWYTGGTGGSVKSFGEEGKNHG